MVFEPLKSIWIQSGNAPGVASFHPAPEPQPAPDLRLSITVDGRKLALLVLEAVAAPPLAASATLACCAETVEVQASTSVTRDHVASAPRTLMRIRSVGYGANETVRLTRLLPFTV